MSQCLSWLWGAPPPSPPPVYTVEAERTQYYTNGVVNVRFTISYKGTAAIWVSAYAKVGIGQVKVLKTELTRQYVPMVRLPDPICRTHAPMSEEFITFRLDDDADITRRRGYSPLYDAMMDHLHQWETRLKTCKAQVRRAVYKRRRKRLRLLLYLLPPELAWHVFHFVYDAPAPNTSKRPSPTPRG